MPPFANFESACGALLRRIGDSDGKEGERNPVISYARSRLHHCRVLWIYRRLAARMAARHIRAAAAVRHFLTAGLFFVGELGISRQAHHGRRAQQCTEKGQHDELAKALHWIYEFIPNQLLKANARK